jgi:hypothetical protein
MSSLIVILGCDLLFNYYQAKTNGTMKKLTALLLLLPVLASADNLPYLKKEAPEKLGLFATVDDFCPLSREEVTVLVNGLLVRSRIKPLASVSEDLYLSVVLDCQENPNLDGAIVVFATSLSTYGEVDGLRIRLRRGHGDYGFFGVADKEALEEQIEITIGIFLADYIETNYGLRDDE